MKILSLMLVALESLTSFSAEPIGFVAHVESESLAEEAILLLHCLSARSNTSWEFSGEIRGSHWLKVQEKKSGTIEGTYRRDAKTRAFSLKVGESEQACDQLEPPTPGIKPLDTAQLTPAISSLENENEQRPSKTWLWVGLGAAAVAGFIFWKTRQPAYRGIEMR